MTYHIAPGFAHGYLVGIDPATPGAERTVFAFPPHDGMGPYQFVFPDLTPEQVAFLARLIRMTDPQLPRCLRPTPWRNP